jgi:hypothetical protein
LNLPADPWLAAEWLVSPDSDCRRDGLAALTADEAVLFTPLVTYLLATRIEEPDLALRRDVVAALARCLAGPGPGRLGGVPTRRFLLTLLAGLDRPRVERLLEVAAGQAHCPEALALLDRVPNLGSLLTSIAADRQTPASLRAAAVAALGELGVLEALPALEGLKTRLEGQKAGQLAMAFAPPSDPDDGKLLAALEAAIAALHEND